MKQLISILIILTIANSANAQTHTLSINPNTCVLQQGNTNCSVFVDWTTNNASDVCLWRLGAGLSPAKVTCLTNGTNIEYPSVTVGGKTLELRYGSQTYSQSTLFESINVYATLPPQPTGDLVVTPSTCELVNGEDDCSVFASWTTNNASDVCLWRLGAGLSPAKVTCLTNGTNIEYPSVTVDGKTLELRYGSQTYSQSTLFESINVYATLPPQPTGDLVVTPSTCELVNGEDDCSVFASWTTNNASDVCLWRLGAGLSPAKVTCLTNGTNIEYPSVTVDGKTLELRYGSQTYSQSTLFESINVYATQPSAFDLIAEIAAANDGDVIVVPVGTHYINQPIIVNKNIRIIGADAANPSATKLILNTCSATSGCLDTSLIKFEGTQSNKLNAVAVKHMTLIGEGMEYTNTGLKDPTDGVVVRFTHVYNSSIKNVVINNSSRMNVAIKNSTKFRVLDSTFNDSGYASYSDPTRPTKAESHVWVNDSSNILVRGNDFNGRNNGPFGDGSLDFHNSSNVTIENNHFSNTGASSVYLVNTHDVTINQNLIENPNENGIDIVNGSSNVTITNNHTCGAGFSAGVVSPGFLNGGIPHDTCPSLIRVFNSNTHSSSCGLVGMFSPDNDLWGIRTGGKEPGIDIQTTCPTHDNWDGVCFESVQIGFIEKTPHLTCTYQ